MYYDLKRNLYSGSNISVEFDVVNDCWKDNRSFDC